MPLTPRITLVQQTEFFLKQNTTESPEEALRKFSEFIVDMVQNEVRNSDIVGITTNVTGAAGSVPVVGTGIQTPGSGQLQ